MTTPIRTISPVNTLVQKPQQIWSAGSGIQPLIVNNDPLNTLYVGAKADVYRQDISSTIPIEPLGSQVWGDYDIYAFAPVACNTMLIIPGASGWNPSPAQVAISAAGLATSANQSTQINTGAPLTTGETNVEADHSNPVIAAGANKVYNIPVTRAGYIIELILWNSTNTTTQLPVEVEVQWMGASGDTLATQIWWVYAGTTATHHVIDGQGPTLGANMKITITNKGAGVNLTMGLVVDETTFAYQRHDWRTDDSGGFVLAGWAVSPNLPPQAFDMVGDMLGVTVAGQAIAASGQINVILPLYNGPCMMNFNSSGAAGSLNVFIASAADVNAPNGNPFSILQPGAANAGFGPSSPVYLPRSQCSVQLANTTAAGINGFYNIYAGER